MMRRFVDRHSARAFLLLAVSVVFLVSCGGDGSPPLDDDPTVEGVLLDGQDNALALSAIVDMLPIPADAADIEDGLLLSRLDTAIAADATIGEVNAALNAINGRIIGMRAGFPVLAIAVPRQTGESALQALADQLTAKSGIRIAIVARQPVAKLAPPPPADAAEALRHLQSAHFPAAWNVKSLAGTCSQRPTVVVADWFVRPMPGNSPYADFGIEVPGVDDNGIGGGGTFPNAGHHGHDVLTTLAAALDDEVPTGANPFPDCLDIRTVQNEGLSPLAVLTAIGASLPATGRVVVNASFGYDGCPTPCTVSSVNAASALQRALEGAWARALLQPLADRVLVTSSAGNEADTAIPTVYAGAGIAGHSSPFNVAAKAGPDMAFAADESLWEPLRQDCSGAVCVSFPSLTVTPEQQARLAGHLADLGLPGRTPATNVLVVGSTTPITQRRSSFSNPGHDVAAIGEGVPVMDKNLDQSFKAEQGTSFAAPQVAALATYLWMISPQLRDGPLADTISAITGNATGEDDQIDAYASVLSLDPVGEPDPATWRVRVALLDVDDSGAFDENDVTAFQTAYEAPEAGQSTDYSRHDLNGDGFTGGEHGFNRFDLDRTGSVRYGAPALSSVYVSIYGAGRDIDERWPSDKDILCYYAYSALYTGDTEARDAELRDWCAEITVEVMPAEISVSPGGTVNFAADVSGAADPGVTWVLPDGGGSITAGGVFTAGQSGGRFTVRAISVEDPNAFGDATVVIQDEGGGPPGSYAGTVTQQVDTSSSSTTTNPDEGWTRVITGVASEVVTWRILAEDGDLNNSTGTIDYLYQSTHTDTGGASTDLPCNRTYTTAGQIPISGMNSNSQGDLYFYGSGQVTRTHVYNCGGESGTETTVENRYFTTLTYYMPGNTGPTLTWGQTQLLALTWDYHWTDPNHPDYTSSVTGSVNYVP